MGSRTKNWRSSKFHLHPEVLTAKEMEFFNFLMEQYAAYKGTAGTPKEEFPRTVPLVSKVCNTQMARLATRLMLGEKLEDLKLKDKKFNHHGAKEAVFPFDKLQKLPRLGNGPASSPAALGLRSFPEGDPVKGFEMRSL